MTGPVDPDRDQLIETAQRALWDARDAGVRHVQTSAVAQAAVVIDALAPVLADRDKRKLREGRNQAAEAIKGSDYFAVPSTRLIASYIVGLARGGSTDEERNDEQ